MKTLPAGASGLGKVTTPCGSLHSFRTKQDIFNFLRNIGNKSTTVTMNHNPTFYMKLTQSKCREISEYKNTRCLKKKIL